MTLKEMNGKIEVCNSFLSTLRQTESFKKLSELRYFIKEGSEIVRPIFENGAGERGEYDVIVTSDSGAAIIVDITAQFVARYL